METDNQAKDRFHAQSRAEWRNWLEANYATSRGVWLVSYKTVTGKPRVSYDAAVEEALCFGWIDSRANTLDEERTLQWFSPRKPGSAWSGLNKRRIKALIEQGLMTPAGLAKIEAAKQDGTWAIYDAIEAMETPADLEEALKAKGPAYDYFQAFNASSKKQILFWIASAKRPETRAKRIEETARLAAENRKANQ